MFIGPCKGPLSQPEGLLSFFLNSKIMLCSCSFKQRSERTLCPRCGKQCLSVTEYAFVMSMAEVETFDKTLDKIDVDKVLKYLARKLQRKLQTTIIKTYKKLLVHASSFSHHLVHLVKTKSFAVLQLALEVLSCLPEKVRYDILTQTLRHVSVEVNLILTLVDGLAIGARFIWTLINATDPYSNLYKALIHRVNKSTLAEQLLESNSKVHLQVLLSESTTLEKKLIFHHVKSIGCR